MHSGRMQRLMDKTAIALSTACAIHCLFLPVVIVMLPALASTSLGGESFHRFLLWFVFPISVLALTQGCRRHKDRVVLTSGVLGLALLLVTAIAGHHVLSEEGERIATVLGATALAFGHVRNYRLCRKSKCSV
ncbi:MerC domain-containing protein [Fischerella sp. PCC 9605]|uniref:MerC domain-containing protein n=1 Tax=Fischerella sp. PCC 9605 TaxID=1173024 RepID=UPI00047B21D8|nr:MerC domain-containing protein [Fischerella sp. PCC 9605]